MKIISMQLISFSWNLFALYLAVVIDTTINMPRKLGRKYVPKFQLKFASYNFH